MGKFCVMRLTHQLTCVQCIVMILVMSEVDLRKIDLNLLVALDVLLDECHITNSAHRLNLSQPAMSRTLARLREAFDDPILVRVPNGYNRTERARALAEPLKAVLDQIRYTLAEPVFDPKSYSGEFRICTLDYGEVVVVPRFMKVISEKAPNAKIVIVHRPIYAIAEMLEGTADIILGSMFPSTPKHCMKQHLYDDIFVCVMHKDHPLAEQELTMEDYVEYPHSIIHTGERPGTQVDDALEKEGLTRRVAKQSPHFFASLMSLGDTNIIQTVPERLAKVMQDSNNLIIKSLPFDIDPIRVGQVWHSRDNLNPMHQWFRTQLEQSVPR